MKSFVRTAFIFIWTFIMSLIAGLCLVLGGKNIGPKWYNFCGRIWSFGILFFCNIKVDVYGLRNIQHLNDGVIFAPNHMSHFDILVLYYSLPLQIRFVFKQQLGDIPVFGWILKRSGNIPVDREHLKPSTIKSVLATLKSGNNIVMFPEGTRSFDGKLQEFKEGPFVLGLMVRATIIPITINGTFLVHNKINPKIVNSGRVDVIIHDPIQTDLQIKNASKEEKELAIKMLKDQTLRSIEEDYIDQEI